MKTFTVREKVTKGIDFRFTKEGPHEILGVPLGQGFLKEFNDTGKDEAIALLHWFDVVPDGEKKRIVKEQNSRDRRALVLVETAPGIGGTVKLFANTVHEVVNDKTQRVQREANPFPPPGVELLAQRDGVLGPEYLISMLPGASFRISRSGKLPSDAFPELVVLWNGRWDFRAAQDRNKRVNMKHWGLSLYERRMRHGDV